ncbi:hypothetical protein EJ063_07610 [Vibrio aquaticus]|uniref:Uncharacterized protein n=1 Tax=Vibrio aquaticus TaxID=2496559 RepID=A0A3S0PPF6_9VIBR|nr:hypothetical protein [Vibrio aquaticus]RTZ16651.1 hypothetical protein EJ063_07610 [Vibrio aquaticus]
MIEQALTVAKTASTEKLGDSPNISDINKPNSITSTLPLVSPTQSSPPLGQEQISPNSAEFREPLLDESTFAPLMLEKESKSPKASSKKVKKVEKKSKTSSAKDKKIKTKATKETDRSKKEETKRPGEVHLSNKVSNSSKIKTQLAVNGAGLALGAALAIPTMGISLLPTAFFLVFFNVGALTMYGGHVYFSGGDDDKPEEPDTKPNEEPKTKPVVIEDLTDETDDTGVKDKGKGDGKNFIFTYSPTQNNYITNNNIDNSRNVTNNNVDNSNNVTNNNVDNSNNVTNNNVDNSNNVTNNNVDNSTHTTNIITNNYFLQHAGLDPNTKILSSKVVSEDDLREAAGQQLNGKVPPQVNFVINNINSMNTQVFQINLANNQTVYMGIPQEKQPEPESEEPFVFTMNGPSVPKSAQEEPVVLDMGLPPVSKSAQEEPVVFDMSLPSLPKSPQEPEVKKPEVKKPEVKKPEVKKPEVKKPELKEPEPAIDANLQNLLDSEGEYASIRIPKYVVDPGKPVVKRPQTSKAVSRAGKPARPTGQVKMTGKRQAAPIARVLASDTQVTVVPVRLPEIVQEARNDPSKLNELKERLLDEVDRKQKAQFKKVGGIAQYKRQFGARNEEKILLLDAWAKKRSNQKYRLPKLSDLKVVGEGYKAKLEISNLTKVKYHEPWE